jgi:hypothetical protein
MHRENLYALIEKLVTDADIEYNQLYRMVFKEKCIDETDNMVLDAFSDSKPVFSSTLENFIDTYLIKKIPIRQTCTSLKGLLARLGLPEPTQQHAASTTQLLLFCELLLAIKTQAETIRVDRIAARDSYETQMMAITENINQIVESISHKIIKTGNGLIIVEENEKALIAATKVDEFSLADMILSYNHHSLQGNAIKKKELLRTLANEIEPLRKGLESSYYKQIASDLGFLLNNLDIRHNNRASNTTKSVYGSIPNKELEAWYDKTYELIITALSLKDTVPIFDDIKNLKKMVHSSPN